MGPRLTRAALASRVAYDVAKERITNPRPLSLREVPPTPEHLTDDSLEAITGRDSDRVLPDE